MSNRSYLPEDSPVTLNRPEQQGHVTADWIFVDCPSMTIQKPGPGPLVQVDISHLNQAPTIYGNLNNTFAVTSTSNALSLQGLKYGRYRAYATYELSMPFYNTGQWVTSSIYWGNESGSGAAYRPIQTGGPNVSGVEFPQINYQDLCSTLSVTNDWISDPLVGILPITNFFGGLNGSSPAVALHLLVVYIAVPRLVAPWVTGPLP